MSEPDPTDVIPTTIPPIIPIAIVGNGRGTMSWTARCGAPAALRGGLDLYQACPAPQCGQTTVVETVAWNRKPHWQL